MRNPGKGLTGLKADTLDEPAGLDSSRGATREWPGLFWPAIAILALCCALCRDAFTGTLLNDDWFLVGARSPRELLPYFRGEFIFGLSGVGGQFRPLTRVWFSAVTWLSGGSEALLHVFHFAVFLAGGLATAALARRLGLGRGFTALAAALFLFFPTQASAAYWLAAVGDLLAWLWIAAALWLFLSPHPGALWLAGLWICAVGGYLTKEIALTLPGLLIATEAIRFRFHGEGRYWRIGALIGTVGLAGGALAWRRAALGPFSSLSPAFEPALPLNVALKVGEFLGVLLNPFTFTMPGGPLAALAVFVIAAGAVVFGLGERRALLPAVWLLLLLSPYFVVGYPVSEGEGQWLFVAPVGIYVLLPAIVAERLWGGLPARRGLLTAVCVVALAALCVAHQIRMFQWTQAEALSRKYVEELTKALPPEAPPEGCGVAFLFPAKERRLGPVGSPVSSWRNVPMFAGVLAGGPAQRIYSDVEGIVPCHLWPRPVDDEGALEPNHHVLVSGFDDIRPLVPLTSKFASATLRIEGKGRDSRQVASLEPGGDIEGPCYVSVEIRGLSGQGQTLELFVDWHGDGSLSPLGREDWRLFGPSFVPLGYFEQAPRVEVRLGEGGRDPSGADSESAPMVRFHVTTFQPAPEG